MSSMAMPSAQLLMVVVAAEAYCGGAWENSASQEPKTLAAAAAAAVVEVEVASSPRHRSMRASRSPVAASTGRSTWPRSCTPVVGTGGGGRSQGGRGRRLHGPWRRMHWLWGLGRGTRAVLLCCMEELLADATLLSRVPSMHVAPLCKCWAIPPRRRRRILTTLAIHGHVTLPYPRRRCRHRWRRQGARDANVRVLSALATRGFIWWWHNEMSLHIYLLSKVSMASV